MATIMKVWRHVKNLTPSICEYLFEEYSCQISIPIWFEKTQPQNNKNKIKSIDER